MRNNVKTGKPRQFPLDYQEAKEKIREYQTLYEENKIDIPSVPGFCAFIGTDTGKFVETINNPVATNNNLADLLRAFGTWCDGVTIDKCPAPIARLLLAQGFGGHNYTEKQEQNHNVKIDVKFGGKLDDPFG